MAKAVAEAKPKKPEGMRELTEAEIADMHGDDTPPAGYANTTLNDAPTETAPEGEKPAEETAPAEKPAEEASTENKPAAEKAAAPAPATEDTFEKLETELAKPEGKEDLTKFSPREKAYFHQMRRDRKARQQAETERDQALFRESKLKKAAETKPAEVEKDPFEGRADDDLITVGELRALNKKKAEPAKPAEAPASEPQVHTAKRYLVMCENEARAAHTDFDAVMELSDELVSGDAAALKEISEQTQKGENPAEVMYTIIKKHKDFEALFPAAEVRAKARKAAAATPASTSAPAATPTPEDKAKEDKAKQAEKALETNANQTKTTAHVSAREGKPAEELTLEEIAGMSDMQFAKLPRHVRQKYLRQYGA